VAATKRDVERLIEFSLLYHMKNALRTFPMFSKKQIAAIYAMSKGARQKLLAQRSSDGTSGSMVRPFPDHRSRAQAQKSAEQAADPSNR
jgi:hypothetical protein